MKVKTEKNIKKPNVIDVVLVIAIIGIVVSLAIRGGFVTGLLISDTRDITYDISVRLLDTEQAESMETGVNVFIGASSTPAGKLIATEHVASNVSIVTASGSSVTGVLPGKSDLTMTVATEATVKEDGYHMPDGSLIVNGMSVEITVSGVVYQGIVVKINEDSDNS